MGRFVGEICQTYQVSERSASLFISKAAFPRCKATDNLWKKCLISRASFFPQRRASRRTMSLRSFTASRSHHPNVSTTSGWKVMPCPWQLSKLARILDDFRISIAGAVVSAARWRMASWVGDTTLTSKAIFRPSTQFAMYTSAGRD